MKLIKLFFYATIVISVIPFAIGSAITLVLCIIPFSIRSKSIKGGIKDCIGLFEDLKNIMI